MPLVTETRETHKLDLAVEVLGSSGAIRLRVLGTSMLPSIWPGDVLRIENKPGNEMVPGDIVLVARDGRFFVHRLIEKHDSEWITRGDSLPQNDAAVTQVQVLGKVSTIHRKGRVMVPNRRVTPSLRTLAWILCHRDSLRNIALHLHSFPQKLAFLSRLFPKPGLRISGIARTFDPNDAYLPHYSE